MRILVLYCLCNFSVNLKLFPNKKFILKKYRAPALGSAVRLCILVPAGSYTFCLFLWGQEWPPSVRSPVSRAPSFRVPTQFTLGDTQLLIFSENWWKNISLGNPPVQTLWLQFYKTGLGGLSINGSETEMWICPGNSWFGESCTHANPFSLSRDEKSKGQGTEGPTF